MSATTKHAHEDLHSEQGALKGEHRGRSRNPIVKVRDIAWLEFEKPDLDRAEIFARVFGFGTSLKTENELHLRGADTGAPCVIIRRGETNRFCGMAFAADNESDVLRLAEISGRSAHRLPDSIGGISVALVDPSGIPVQVIAGTNQLDESSFQTPLTINTGHQTPRINHTQRRRRAPATVQRLGHVVLQSTKYAEALDWYLDTLGLIVSDFLYFPGQRARGPAMSFMRCDRGSVATDHHTLAMALGPANRYVHSAYQVSDLDSLAAGGQHLKDHGYQRSWGIGRHIQGSQIFDYWRDPDGFLVEHFTDGDMFDNTLEPGWSAFTATGLAQWGPPATKDFLGTSPRHVRGEASSIVSALRTDNEFDLRRLVGLLKVAAK